MIVKLPKGGFAVKSEDGTKLLGVHKTKEDALKQLRAIEYYKNRGKK